MPSTSPYRTRLSRPRPTNDKRLFRRTKAKAASFGSCRVRRRPRSIESVLTILPDHSVLSENPVHLKVGRGALAGAFGLLPANGQLPHKPFAFHVHVAINSSPLARVPTSRRSPPCRMAPAHVSTGQKFMQKQYISSFNNLSSKIHLILQIYEKSSSVRLNLNNFSESDAGGCSFVWFL
jgi:hypothetical protein